MLKKKKESNNEITMPEDIVEDLKESVNEKEINPQKKDNIHKKVATTESGYGYDVEMYDVWDTTSRRLQVIGANRVIEGDNVYLYNKEKGFKQPFPENSDEYKRYKIDELDSEIKRVEKQIALTKNNKTSASLKDLFKELRIYNNWKRSLELQGRGSYMIINSNGKPLFMFDRVGSLKMPLFKNVDRSLIYTPTEQKTQEVIQLLKENDLKNGEQHTIKIATYGLIIVLVLGVCFMFWIGWKMTNLPVEFVQIQSEIAQSLFETSKDLNNLSSSINSMEINNVNPDTVVSPNTQNINGR